MDWLIIVSNSVNSDITVGRRNGEIGEVSAFLLELAIRDRAAASGESISKCMEMITPQDLDFSEPDRIQLIMSDNDSETVYTAIGFCSLDADFTEIGSPVNGINFSCERYDYSVHVNGTENAWKITISDGDISKTFRVKNCPMNIFSFLTRDEIERLFKRVSKHDDSMLEHWIYSSINSLLYCDAKQGGKCNV